MICLITRWTLDAPQRSVYTLLSVAVAFFTFIMLMTLSAPFTKPEISHSRTLHSINAGSAASGLPIKYVERIAAVKGVESVSWFGSLAVNCGSDAVASIMAVGGASFNYQVALDAASAEAISVWRTDRRGLLVGSAVAERCGWRPGQIATAKALGVNTGVGAARWTFLIAGIFDSKKVPFANQAAYGHYAYVNAGRGAFRDKVRMILVKVAAGADVNKTAERIDSAFARGYPPTRTIANTHAQATLARFGDVRGVTVWILGAVFFCMLLVTVNVMGHAVAERLPALAVLNALGFRRLRIASLVVTENAILLGLGAAAGVGGGFWATNWLAPAVVGVLTRFTVPPAAIGAAVGLAAGSIVISTLLPVAQVVRLKPSHCLRS